MPTLDIATMLIIAIGLAMDAFSVSVVYGMTGKGNSKGNVFKMASSFGAFQTFMPVLGWLIGVEILELIAGFDHWLAFVLLALIGCKMIYEATNAENRPSSKRLDFHTLLLLSVATSMDALTVGLSFAFLRVSIIALVIIIGVVTFVLSFMGGLLSNIFCGFRISRIEILGGLILIAIGAKILLEHLALC